MAVPKQDEFHENDEPLDFHEYDFVRLQLLVLQKLLVINPSTPNYQTLTSLGE